MAIAQVTDLTDTVAAPRVRSYHAFAKGWMIAIGLEYHDRPCVVAEVVSCHIVHNATWRERGMGY